jgi:putative glutamine amidotransferase
MDGIPENIPDSWVMSRRYFVALAQAGAVPVMVPLLDDDPATLRALWERLDGVFLAGGVDMDPSTYGQARSEWCGRTDLARDAVELQLVRWSLAEGKPLLGVCRGLHVMNVAAGGTLWQDCTALFPGSLKHDYFPTQGFDRDYLAHEVNVVPGSRLEAALHQSHVTVNSMHHQGIRQLGAGLHVTARAPDGLIEAIESTGDGFALAVQWHPEALEDAETMARLFRDFTAACAAGRRDAAGAARIRTA